METPEPSALQGVLSALRLLPNPQHRLDERRYGREGRALGWAPEPVSADVSLAETPLMTIVTPSLNQGRFLEQTLRSVLEQGYPRLQYLVIDGGSSDETVFILEKYRRRYPGVLDYVSEEDRGQAHALNKGFDRARGEIIGWLNSDDTYALGCLHHVARTFVENPDTDLIYGHARYISEDGRPIDAYPTRSEFDWHALAHECFICQPSVFWHRRVLERGHRLNEALDLCMDYDFWIRLGRELEVRFVDRQLASSRLHADAKTVRDRSRIFDEVFATVRRHYGFVPVSWVLGKAHHACDRPVAGSDERRPTWKTYVAALWLALSHNVARPRYWPVLLREGAGILRRKLRKKWARGR